MGLHRTYEIQPPSPNPLGPFPLPPPKSGKEKMTCRNAEGGWMEFEITDEDEKKFIKLYGEDWYSAFFQSGSIIKKNYHEDSYGEPKSPAPWKEGKGSSDSDRAKDLTTEAIDGESYPFDYEKDSKKPGHFEKTKSPHAYPPPEEMKVSKVETKSSRGKFTTTVEGENPKKELLDNKINLKPQPEDDPLNPGQKKGYLESEPIVKTIISDLSFTDTYVDAIGDKLPLELEFKDMYIFEALEMLAKLAGANFYIDSQGNFHWFKPGSRKHPVIATTDPISMNQLGFPVNPIQEGTFKSIDATIDQTNHIQVFTKEGTIPYQESQIADGEKHEFHLSYGPQFCTLGVSITPAQPYDSGIEKVMLDWKDRAWLEAGYPGVPIITPECMQPVTSTYIVYFNPLEKCLRFVDKTTGLPLPPQSGDIINVIYSYKVPVWYTVSESASIEQYGLKQRIIVSPEGMDKKVMKMLAEAEIRDSRLPQKQLEFRVFDDVYNVGDTVHVINPKLKIDGWYTIYEVERTFDVRLRGTQEDPGQSVLIKLGDKIPIKLDDVLVNINQRIRALERAYMPLDNNVPGDGALVPKEQEEYVLEDMVISDSVSFEFVDMEGRVDETRVDSGRTK